MYSILFSEYFHRDGGAVELGVQLGVTIKDYGDPLKYRGASPEITA